MDPWTLAFVGIATFIMVGFSNAVNLTDGLDGLAAGCTAITGFAFIILSLVVGVAVHRVIRAEADQASAAIAAIAGVGANETIDDHRAVEAESP